MALGGKRILVTRAAHQASALADLLRAEGAEAIVIPSIEIVPPQSFNALDQALAELSSYDWLIFTSANAVQVFAERLRHLAAARAFSAADHSLGSPKNVRVAVIGRATERASQAIGLQANLVPPQAVAESLTEALLPEARRRDGSAARMLLIRAEEARDHLPVRLIAAGAEVTIAVAYRTIVPAGSVELLRSCFTGENMPNAVTFTSASTVRNLRMLLDVAQLTLPMDMQRVSIGPVTSQALVEHGWPAHVEARSADLHGLVEAVRRALSPSA